MVRFAGLLVIALATLGCKKKVIEYVYVCDGGPADGPGGDPDAVVDTAVDAFVKVDASADAQTCQHAGDMATSYVTTGGAGGPVAQLTVDGFGVASTVVKQGGASGTLYRLGANGQERQASTTITPLAIALAFDGTQYWVVENVLTDVKLTPISAAGVVGTSITIGTGTGVPGALAIHASGEKALLWVSGTDGSLRSTVVTTGGSLVETTLDARPFVVDTQILGGITALGGGATTHFLAAFEDVNGASGAVDVTVAPLQPNGTFRSVATAGATTPQRVSIAQGDDPGFALVTWRESATDVHAALVDAQGSSVHADTIVLSASGLSRVAGRALPGGAFEVLVDHVLSSTDRAIELRTYDATATQTGSTRRIATICALSYNEENLPFVRNSGIAFSTWFDATLDTNVVVTF